MKILITFIFLTINAVAFSADMASLKYKQSFIEKYLVIKANNTILIKEKFGSHVSRQAVNGLIFYFKSDKHISIQYKITVSYK